MHALDATEVSRHWEDNAEAWARQAREGLDVFRDALNTPAFLALLPPIAGLRGLDVGCGEGSNTRQLARLGARMSAVDIAPTFVRYARASEVADPLGIDYVVGDGMQLPFADGAFDFATAFMSLMDMPDPARALLQMRRVVRPGGFVQFSILHPCFVAPHRKVVRDRKGKARAIEIGGYFESTEGRVDCWWFSTLPVSERTKVAPFHTPIFHRTLSQWFEILGAAGLVVEKLGEPTAGSQLCTDRPAQPVIEDTRVAPMSLHVRARRPCDGG